MATKKICLTCEKLGKCSDASVRRLEEDRGCGSWTAACEAEVSARVEAIAIAGSRALNALILKSPPKNKAKEYRR